MKEIKFRQFCSEEDNHQYGMNYSDVYEGCIKDGDWSEPMQFTGLLDKNGKEIYDGDILRIDYNHSNSIMVIKYILSYNFSGFGFMENMNTSEIIGNIYENPELLNK